MKNVATYIDLAFCLAVLPVMALIFPIERWFHNFQWYVISVGIWLYALYFINRLLTVPCLFATGRRKATGIILIILSLVITASLSRITLYIPKPNVLDVGIARVLPVVLPYQQAVWSLFMIVEAFSFAVGLLTEAARQRTSRRAVEAERDRAEIELYKAQIKPHFMFNTLNSLYGLFLTQSPNALPSLEKFISMMRHIHTSSHCDFIPLAAEAEYIRQFVEIQSLRLSHTTKVSLTVEIADEGLSVPPMLLVTFVENCFKHGVSPVEPSTISISLIERSAVLELKTSNRIFPVKRIGEHMGIENCRRRLRLLYPGRHELSIREENDKYLVNLIIQLEQ